MAFTIPAAPVSCSLMGRPPRRVLCARPRLMGMLGAVSGLLCAEFCAGIIDMGRGLGLAALVPVAIDLARWRSETPTPSISAAGGWGNSVSSIRRAFAMRASMRSRSTSWSRPPPWFSVSTSLIWASANSRRNDSMSLSF